MKVLVTGGCGFVGRAFARRLLSTDDNEVLLVDNLVAGIPPDRWDVKPKYAERMTFIQDDMRRVIRDRKFVPDQFDLIIHCAAIVGGRMTIEGDPLRVATDLSIDADFFDWVVRGKFPVKVIYFSSSAVYPIELQTERCNVALSEGLQGFASTRVGLPDMTYGYVKLTGEYLAKFAHEHYGLDVRIYRPFGGYGEGQDFSYPFPSIVQRVKNGENPVIVWGSGDQIRDFIHIDDVVSGVLATMGIPELVGKPLNLGTGLGISFNNLALRIAHVLGCEITVQNDATKPEGVFARVADPAKMFRWFRPSISLDEGIMRVSKALDTKASRV